MTAEVETYMAMAFMEVIRPDELTSGEPTYLAYNPDMPGCMAHGRTVEEARASLADARRLYIESLVADGQPVPQPTTTASIEWRQLSATEATRSPSIEQATLVVAQPQAVGTLLSITSQ